MLRYQKSNIHSLARTKVTLKYNDRMARYKFLHLLSFLDIDRTNYNVDKNRVVSRTWKTEAGWTFKEGSKSYNMPLIDAKFNLFK